MFRLFLLFLCFAFVFILPAQAQPEDGPFFSGAYLLELCKKDGGGGEKVKRGHTACQAYIAGVIDYHDLLRSLGTSPSVDMCVPNTAKTSDLQNIVLAYLEKNAQHDPFSAAPAVALALFEVYPCPKKKTSQKRKRNNPWL